MSRRIRSLPGAIAAGVLVVFGAMPAAGQDPSDPLVRLDATSRFAVEAIIDSAFAAGLPGAALRSKALEGISKKADNRAIVGAVRAGFLNLKTARATLGGVPDE